ncbi:L-2-hydroxyglutarate dehydrogenase mitochondrial precursor [Eremomyces bilateralis CBS 781.70]|uniref:L-2-hydroxyglutarate dehydrogenase, mitochondrial n=1 Tax=Eremomyces bilateralis CBS 781.70 TaxID=1392243 RepID=A0A6G1G0T2_9PEZI|nr:L-2-hydroxyglutarate dehydrogenase mitochondrial precursor [Eremomyces bilateralis CBS 781.70]KAF1811536.1 L-2-hydroxyglutarate dehydrogenase mitochondrial precursor [Eremomyces bilateralis CBS 781.70]
MSSILGRHVARTVRSPLRPFSSRAPLSADFQHAVIGGGVVGLAVARKLQSRGADTILIEKHGGVGTETSSRNSEVIHAGLYYGKDSLKTKLCVRGRILLYELCEKYSIPYRNCGKWIVAQDDAQFAQLEKTHAFTKEIGVPTHFVSAEEAKRREPDVRAEAGVLESPTTGIVDSHSLMQYLQGDFEDKGGTTAFLSKVESVTPLDHGSKGWQIEVSSPDSNETTTITTETFINSAGLSAIPLSNTLLPPERQTTPAYAKGSYYSYSSSRPKPSHLIYPAHSPGIAGLGTHLTIDMGGRIRFGPDVLWVDDPTDYRVSDAHLAAALAEISAYLPGVDKGAIALDYAGIRPKMGRAGSVVEGKGFLDFYIKREEGFEGWVNLLGIESPGLTSSLAIAEEVESLLYR